MPNRRTVVAGLSAAGLAGCSAVGRPDSYDAVVSKTARSEGFATVAEAVAAAPGDRLFRVLVSAGVWRERVTIDKPLVQLVGEGRDATTIVFNRSAGDAGADGKPVGTFGTATVQVRAPDFSAAHLTIANDFDTIVHPPTTDDRTGPSGLQAVALAVQDKADRTFVEDCRISGNQDTLFVDCGRSLFRNSTIEGSVDFIFGGGRAVFETCEILSRRRPGQDFNGYIAAPDTNLHQRYGLVFIACRLVKEPGLAAHSVALGRPWRRTGTFPDGRYGDPEAVGAATFLYCRMDDHIVPEGWHPMAYNAKGGARVMMQPEDARLYEFGSSGPGAGAASARRRILSADEARAFEPRYVLEGWRPPVI